MKRSIRLLDYTEDAVYHGVTFICQGVYPYEDIVNFLVCEFPSGEPCRLIVSSGYKAGLTLVVLPEESMKEVDFGISTNWLKENWYKWIYPDCPIDKVKILENTPAWK